MHSFANGSTDGDWSRQVAMALYVAFRAKTSIIYSIVSSVLTPAPTLHPTARLPAQQLANTLITPNHHPTRRCHLGCPGDNTRKQRAPAFRPHDMNQQWKRTRRMVQRLWRTRRGRGEHLASGLEDVKGCGEDGCDGAGEGAGNEGHCQPRTQSLRFRQVFLGRFKSRPVQT